MLAGMDVEVMRNKQAGAARTVQGHPPGIRDDCFDATQSHGDGSRCAPCRRNGCARATPSFEPRNRGGLRYAGATPAAVGPDNRRDIFRRGLGRAGCLGVLSRPGSPEPPDVPGWGKTGGVPSPAPLSKKWLSVAIRRPGYRWRSSARHRTSRSCCRRSGRYCCPSRQGCSCRRP